MKYFLFSGLIFLFVLGSSMTSLAEAPRYPHVIDYHGKLLVTTKGQVEVKIEKNVLLRESAVIETHEDSYLKIQWDPVRYVVVEPKTKLSIPNISWETGEAPILILDQGSVHWDQAARAEYNVVLKSSLFEFIAPIGNFVLSIDLAKAYTEIKVIKGSMEFFPMNGEHTVNVQTGQKAFFQGILDGNDVAYDVLLKGKKIPRGKLSEVFPFTKEEAALYSEQRQEMLKKESQLRESEEKARLAKIHAGMVCKNPYAKLNQCAWVCKNNPRSEKRSCRVAPKGSAECVRSRCDVNGRWSDPTVLSGIKASLQCKIDPVVAACDY